MSSKKLIQQMRNKNLQIIHHNCQNEYNQCSNLIDYLHKRNFNLFYVYDNIFNILKLDANGIAQNYYKMYRDGFHLDNAKMKYLCDCFLHEPIKTVFTISEYDTNDLRMSKGAKKRHACAVSKKLSAGIFIISKTPIGQKINSEDEIYDILKGFDPSGDVFSIELNEQNQMPSIHIIENIQTQYNWFHMDSTIEQLFPLTKLTPNQPVLLLGNAQTRDTQLDVTYIKKMVSTVNELTEISEQYPMYPIIVSSVVPMEITSEYLGFIQCDFYKKAKNQIGIADNLLVYNRHKGGIINTIPAPPCPAKNGMQLEFLL